MSMKKVLFWIAVAFAVCVAVGCVLASSLKECVENAGCAAILVGTAVFFVGGIIYSHKADKEVAAKKDLQIQCES